MQAPPPGPDTTLESTAALIERAQGGDEGARETLFARVLPVLRRWAHRRVPARLRTVHETDDFVQVALLRAFQRLETFEARGPGALLAFLRSVLLNVVRDELRRAAVRPAGDPLDTAEPSRARPVPEEVAGRRLMERYEHALARLGSGRQEVVIMRLELGMSYPDIASRLGLPSAGAARMQVARALITLSEAMRDHA
jgi:RNA polymerase sigma-70 factor (ECF subfamily)